MSKKQDNLKNQDNRTFDTKDESSGGDNVQQNEEEYDPHLYRQVAKPTTYAETLIHVLKGCLGTGILAMPQAFMYSGMLNGIISTILISILCTYTVHVLIKSQYVLCKQLKVPLLTYSESMRVACEVGPSWFKKFASVAPDITNFFLIFNHLGICCVYVVFVAVNLKDVVEVYIEPTKFPKQVYIASIIVPFLLILFIPNLKVLAPFSVVANIITLVTFIVVGYYVCQNLKNFSDLPAFGTLFDYALYLGTALFSIQTVGVFITLENNMKNPKKFGGTFGILNIGMFVITVFYVVMPMLGYWRYGSDIKDSITLNFPPKDILGHVIKLLYSAAIFISYGLQGFVPVFILWNDYIDKRAKTRKYFWGYLLRFCCVLLTVILAATVPLLGLFISLVGAVSSTALNITFPAIMEISAHWPDNLGCLKWILIKDIILIIVGIVGLCAGSYSCIYSIVVNLSGGGS